MKSSALKQVLVALQISDSALLTKSLLLVHSGLPAKLAFPHGAHVRDPEQTTATMEFRTYCLSLSRRGEPVLLSAACYAYRLASFTVMARSPWSLAMCCYT